MRARIDTETGSVTGIDVTAKYTLSEIEGLQISCPVCSGQVFVSPVEAGGYLDANPRRYMIGRAQCIHGCNFTAGRA